MEPSNYLTLTDKEEKIINLFIGLGLKRNVARVLVYLSTTDEATSRMIERGTDLRQPEVSMAMRQLRGVEWIRSKAKKTESKGRPVKIYRLTRTIAEIMGIIEAEKKKEAKYQLDLIQELRETISK
ncbi:MAG: ArsR family transcriptional regulator [Methanomicrobiales archaeon]|nr:ArsR family transcriptional regulator [Methanomicrobiales archaeon]